MNNELLICSNCKKNITSRSDLNILQFFGLTTQTFCNDCYAIKDRSIKHHYFFGSKTSITSPAYTLELILTTLVGVFINAVFFFTNIYKNGGEFFIIFVAMYDIVIALQWLQLIRIKRFVDKFLP